MPRFEPFPGVRYDLGRAPVADVTAPPYDVIDADDRAALVARHPHNVVVVDLPVGGPDPYGEADATFRRWLDEGVLVRDEPAFYVYRMSFRDEAGTAHHTTGVIGALELSRPGEGGILPHEQTTKKAKTDRLDLLRATRANLSAVWGLSPAPGLTAMLPTEQPPTAAWADDDGVEHAVWIVSDPRHTTAIAAAVAAHPVVIADGHHRYETSLAYRDEQRATGGDAPAGHDLVMTYVVELVDDELTVAPIHRLVSGLPDDLDLPAALAASFRVEPAPDPSSVTVDDLVGGGRLCLVGPGGAWWLTPRPEAFGGVRDLDTSRLDAALADLPPHELVFQHGIANVVARVRRGDAQWGVLLRPATVGQIVDIAHGGERMPPKTTFFHPKPRTGVVFRTLD
ncbi:MAG: DUF1015 domain-containing protein [Acidimicrobiales bacterium]